MDIGLIFSGFIIFVLLVLSGFFSGSETALTAASRVRLMSREKEGSKRAAMVNRIRDHKDRMIGALLLGNNLVNIMASALATSVLMKVFGEAGVVYATLIMTLLVLIFAEVLPKTYAFHNAESLAMRIAPVIRVVIIVFAPITEAVTWIVRRVLKLFGVDISMVAAGSHLELLRGVIEMHEGPEQETQEQRAMLRSILELAEVDVEDIMVHRKNVALIHIDQPMDKIVAEVMNSPYTRLPLWLDNPDNIVGVIHSKQLLRELLDVGGKVQDIDMPRIMMEPWFIPETTNLFDRHPAPFVIHEHDEPMRGVRKLPNGSYVVDGTVSIRDLNREFDWGLNDDEYSTIAGLVLYESQMVPDVGQTFRFHNFKIDIVRKQRNQITVVRVTPPEKNDDFDI